MNSRAYPFLLCATVMVTSALPALADTPYCREFTKTIQIAGKPQEAYGTACQQPDGSWEPVTDMMVEGRSVETGEYADGYFPVGQSPQPIIVQPQTVYVEPRPVYSSTSMYFGSRGSGFGMSYGSDPYYTHGRYYNPYYWDRHWDHHRRYYSGWRGNSRGHGGHHGRH